jgi:O-antigen/teichoic acid export membrane protein
MYDKRAKDDVKRYLSLSMKYLFFFSVPAFFGLTIFARELLVLLSTERIAAEGYLIVPIIAASVLLWGLSVIYSQTIILAKRTKIIGAITVGGALTNFILNLLFIPIFGIIGAAVTTLIAYCVLAGGKIYYSRRFLSFPFDLAFLTRVLISSIMMFVFLCMLNNILTMSILVLFAMIGMGLAVYLIFMFAFGGIDRKMFRELKVLIKD